MRLKYQLKFEIISMDKSDIRNSILDSIINEKEDIRYSTIESDFPIREPKTGDRLIISGYDHWVKGVSHEYYISDNIAYDDLIIHVNGGSKTNTKHTKMSFAGTDTLDSLFSDLT